MIIVINSKGIEYTCQYDDCDHDLISKHRWCRTQGGYAVSRINNKLVYMHRLILGLTERSQICDHKNHNKLDNRRENLRIATGNGNMMNKSKSGKSSKYLGVFVMTTKAGRRYIMAQIISNGKRMYLGLHKTEELAALAYDAAASKYHGEFANLNFKQAA